MEPFKVTCVTCRARLSVRDESAIGQIFACPRCGSMVHVAPPTVAAAAALPSAAAKPVAAPTPAPAPVDDASFILDGDAAPPAPPSEPPAAVSTFDDAVEATSAADQPPSAPQAPAAPVAGGWGPLKFAAVTGGAALAGSALVAAALLVWNRNPSPSEPTVAANQSPAPSAPSEPVVELDEPPVAPVEPPVSEAVNAAPAPEPPANDPDAELAFEPPAPEQQVVDPAAPAAIPTPDLRTGRLSDQSAPPKDPPGDAAPPEHPKPRLRIDPLELDPEGLDLRTLLDGPPRDPLEASQAAAPSAEAAASMAPPPVPNAPPAPPVPPDAPVRREAIEAAVAQPANVDALLARKYASVKVDGMPLARFLDFAGEMSGLPISVSPAMLRRAAVNSATAVKVDAKDATIEATLSAALEPLRLAPRLDDNRIVLERAAGDKRRKVDYNVDDLAADDAGVKLLAERLQRFAAPESWQAAGGDAVLTIDGQTLQIDALESAQYEALFFLERYRTALGLPTRTKYPASMLAPSSPHAEVAARLAAPATLTFSQYTPLREIFRYWHDELDLAVLVDWPALAGERLSPDARIAASAADKPWAEAFDSILRPLGLTWRAIDARTIEITSLEQDRLQPETAFYRLTPGAKVDGASLAAQVAQIAAESTPDQAAGAPAAPHASDYDAARRLLMVRLSAATQRRVAEWLAEQSLLAPR